MLTWAFSSMQLNLSSSRVSESQPSLQCLTAFKWLHPYNWWIQSTSTTTNTVHRQSRAEVNQHPLPMRNVGDQAHFKLMGLLIVALKGYNTHLGVLQYKETQHPSPPRCDVKKKYSLQRGGETLSYQSIKLKIASHKLEKCQFQMIFSCLALSPTWKGRSVTWGF